MWQKRVLRTLRGKVDYLSWQFVSDWDSPNSESVLVTAGTKSMLVEHAGVAMQSFAGWINEGGLHGEFQKNMGDFEHGH